MEEELDKKLKILNNIFPLAIILVKKATLHDLPIEHATSLFRIHSTILSYVGPQNKTLHKLFYDRNIGCK